MNVIPFTNNKDFFNNKVGSKATTLSNLYSKGLNVPKGFCISSDVYEFFLKFNYIPGDIIQTVKDIKRELGGKIAIRSSANFEDGSDLSMAGVFSSKFVYHDDDIEKVIIDIYTQTQSKEVKEYFSLHNLKHSKLKMSLIVQKLIEADYSGVIYTGYNKKNYLVEYFDGYNAEQLDVEKNCTTMVISSDGYITNSKGYDIRPLKDIIIDKMVENVEIIKNHYSDVELDIEFCLKDDDIFILQVRPLTTPIYSFDFSESVNETISFVKQKLRQKVKNEKKELGTYTAIFSDANYSELLPRPTEMDIGIYTYIFTGITSFGGTQIARKEMGYRNDIESIGIIDRIGGKVYFSVSRNAALYYIGYPNMRDEYFKTLVNEYLTKISANKSLASYPQIGLYLQDPTMDDLIIRYQNKAFEYYEIYNNFILGFENIAKKFYDEFNRSIVNTIEKFIAQKNKNDLVSLSNEELVNYIFDVLDHLKIVTCVSFVKAARLGFYYSNKIINLLQEKFNFSKDDSQIYFSKLTQGLEGSKITDINLLIYNAETDAEALKLAQHYLGHICTGEMLEIHNPIMSEQEDDMMFYIRAIRSDSNYMEKYHRQKRERIETENFLMSRITEKEKVKKCFENAQKYMALRETIKYYISKEYALIKYALDCLDDRIMDQKGDIYYVYPDELYKVTNQLKKIKHLITSRKNTYKNYDKLSMPSVICEEDIEFIDIDNNINVDTCLFRGTFLAPGESFLGIVINIDEFKSAKELNEVFEHYRKDSQIVLAAKQLNLSHDPYIALSDGLIIENSGIVAHGAQRARELGKGAVGNIKSYLLKTGTSVFFDPNRKEVKIIN